MGQIRSKAHTGPKLDLKLTGSKLDLGHVLVPNDLRLTYWFQIRSKAYILVPNKIQGLLAGSISPALHYQERT